MMAMENSYLRVDSVSITYPLFNRARSTLAVASTMEDGPEPMAADAQLVRDRKGRICAIRALSDISFAIEGGERVAILGRNGSGKTTLLQVLAGIYPPQTGTVTAKGTATSIVNINLGMRGEATGHRNITLRGLASGRSRPEIEAKRDEIAAFSGLGEFLHLPVETYSAGMRMRLNFAIATAFDPDILILDEWLSAGDAEFQKLAGKRMARFVSSAGILVLASHSRRLLEQNCERAIWLDQGRILADGPIMDVMKEYDSMGSLPRKAAR
ncbi:ABC transporter ATP-binding protein [Glycocaulis alkaliphilus]|nr:ABC transporter ATP-binding protein [Glycocaulis alkaliphilus]